MNKLLIAIFAFVLIISGTRAQAQNGYYATDSLIISGIKLVEGGEIINSRFCQIKKGESIIRFTPNEVFEYGFGKDVVYFSRKIQIEGKPVRVFLKRLAYGKLTLYSFRNEQSKIYIIEDENLNLTYIPEKESDIKNNHRIILNTVMADCPATNYAVKLVRYNHNSMAELVNRYNQCIEKPFPHFRFGILVGYQLSKLNVPGKFKNDFTYQFDYKYENSINAGVFAEFPVSTSDFSVFTEISVCKTGYSYTRRDNRNDVDFVANLVSVTMPVMLRYNMPVNFVRPFFQIGGSFQTQIRNESMMFETNVDRNTASIVMIANGPALNQFNPGITAGTGLEIKLNYRRALFLEARYSYFPLMSIHNKLETSQINLNTSINF
jgi:hypothetical protein